MRGVEFCPSGVIHLGQTNAPFEHDVCAAALGKPIIVLQPPAHDHALKEVDAAANAVARTPEQVARVLRYIATTRL